MPLDHYVTLGRSGLRVSPQLDANLGALDVVLTAAQEARLGELSKPVLPFPAAFLARAGSFMHGGITVNGDTAAASPFAPKAGDKTH